MSKGFKCINCQHVIDYNEDKKIWYHKHILHDDNCECEKPASNWEFIQNEINKAMTEAMKDYKHPHMIDHEDGIL